MPVGMFLKFESIFRRQKVHKCFKYQLLQMLECFTYNSTKALVLHTFQNKYFNTHFCLNPVFKHTIYTIFRAHYIRNRKNAF